MSATKVSKDAKVKKAGQQLQKLSDEEAFKVIMHDVRQRLRAKETKYVGFVRELIRELGDAGV